MRLLLEGAEKEQEEEEEEEREEEEEGEVIGLDEEEEEDEVEEIAAPVPSLVARRKRIKELLGELVDLLVV